MMPLVIIAKSWAASLGQTTAHAVADWIKCGLTDRDNDQYFQGPLCEERAPPQAWGRVTWSAQKLFEREGNQEADKAAKSVLTADVSLAAHVLRCQSRLERRVWVFWLVYAWYQDL